MAGISARPHIHLQPGISLGLPGFARIAGGGLRSGLSPKEKGRCDSGPLLIV